MIAALIAVISLAALLQFCISYCRSVIAASRRVALSEQVREITGIENSNLGGDEFDRLLQLVRLCPERSDDRAEINFVGAYYEFLQLLRRVARPVVPRIAEWAEQERESCSYFIAVVLDRRISYSRDLLAQQMAEQA